MRAQVAGILSFSSCFLSPLSVALLSQEPSVPYPLQMKPKHTHVLYIYEETTPLPLCPFFFTPSNEARAGCNPWLWEGRREGKKGGRVKKETDGRCEQVRYGCLCCCCCSCCCALWTFPNLSKRAFPDPYRTLSLSLKKERHWIHPFPDKKL